jgi:hypothetical protein
VNDQPAGSIIRRRLRYVPVVLTAWAIFLVLVSILPALSGFFTWGEAVRMTLNQWFPWVALSPFLLWFTLRFPIERGGSRWRIPAHLIVALASIFLCAWLSRYLIAPSGPPFRRDLGEGTNAPAPFQNPGPDRDRNDFAGGPPRDWERGQARPFRQWRGAPGWPPPVWERARFNIPICVTMLSLCHALAYFRRSQQRDRRALELEAQLGQARLQALRMQLHPHFLFNTLNSIATLVEANPPGAREMIGSLGQMLRLSLDSGPRPEVPLEQEWEFLECYLEIERIRFGDRLQVKLELGPGVGGALVPTFILQPLAENAIRHGIEPASSPGTIEIRAERGGGVLFLSIRDTGPGLGKGGLEQAAPKGIGLANTRARLQSHYPGRHRFTIRNGPGGGCLVELELPFHTEPMPAAGVSQES